MRRRIFWLAVGVCMLAAAAFLMRPTRRQNLLLITLDTTRADRIGCYGYAPAKTPVLDSLAASGALCEQTSTIAPITLAAHSSLFTALYPAETGLFTNGRGKLDDKIPTLAKELEKQGYDTAAFVAAMVLNSKHGLNQGFRMYDDDFIGDEASPDIMHRQRSGAAVVDAALHWLGLRRSKPFFCWVHLFDPHAPYLSHSEMFGDEFADRPYDAEVAYVDWQVGRLLEWLKQQGHDSNTLVVVVGDHGEGLRDHLEPTHGLTLYEDVLRVPLIFRLPGHIPDGTRVAQRLSLVDASPTILDLLGVADRRKTSGRSFKPALMGGNVDPRPCYAQTDEPFLVNGWCPLRSLTDVSWKYIRTTKVELYDLEQDPHERHNLAADHPERVATMENRLKDLESQMIKRSAPGVKYSAAEKRMLASLGYLGEPGKDPAARTDQAPEQRPDVKDMLPFENAVDEALELIKQRQFDPAIAMLHDTINRAPAFSKAYWYLAGALRDKQDLDASAAVLEKMLDNIPNSRQGHFGLGMVRLQQGMTEAAIRQFEETLVIEPDFGEAHFNLARAFLQLKRPEDALSHLTELLDQDPRHVPALNMRAKLLASQGQIAEALDDYQSALQYEPESPQLHHDLGVLLWQNGYANDALKHLTRAVELNPRNPQFHYSLGSLLLQQGNPGEAVGSLSRAVEIDPDFAPAKQRLQEAQQAQQGRSPQ
jgi:arylsulfatase A-like enzyme/tetratricopeptide (TPR) repeat protein